MIGVMSFAPRAEISEFFPAATCIFAPALLLCGGLIVYSFLGDQHDAAASAKPLACRSSPIGKLTTRVER